MYVTCYVYFTYTVFDLLLPLERPKFFMEWLRRMFQTRFFEVFVKSFLIASDHCSRWAGWVSKICISPSATSQTCNIQASFCEYLDHCNIEISLFCSLNKSGLILISDTELPPFWKSLPEDGFSVVRPCIRGSYGI